LNNNKNNKTNKKNNKNLTIKNQDTENDSTFEYILPACARISKALGASFEPFLNTVMEPLLRGANQTIQFSMVDANDDDEDLEDDVFLFFIIIIILNVYFLFYLFLINYCCLFELFIIIFI
jgi:hypothetical protein